MPKDPPPEARSCLSS